MKKFSIYIHSSSVVQIDIEAEDLDTAKEEALEKFMRTPLANVNKDWEARPTVCDVEEEEES